VHSKLLLKEPVGGVGNLRNFALVATLGLAPHALFAGTPASPNAATIKHDYAIKQRKENQGDRIAQDLKSGQLRPAQGSSTRRLASTRKSAACGHKAMATSPNNIAKLCTNSGSRNRVASMAMSTRTGAKPDVFVPRPSRIQVA